MRKASGKGSGKAATALSRFDGLKTRQRELRDGWAEAVALRIHRATSWFGRAEQEPDDPDLRFILLWIAFNAAYADEIRSSDTMERELFHDYFSRLMAHDSDQAIFAAVWDRFPAEIRLLLDNRYIFQPFWNFHNGQGGLDWHRQMEAQRRAIHKALAARDTATILARLFDRLYVLRNQLVHGGATWNSSANRAQVKDGAAILLCLVPLFIEVMMANPEADWGRPFYPVVRD